jgi:malonate decarboxylase epsilon subunit
VSVALLFPGQGSQVPGFLHALPECHAVQSTLAEASVVLGEEALLLDTAEALAGPVPTQLSLCMAGVAFARFLAGENIPITAAAGLSVGVFAAAVATGSLKFADALRLVRRRAELMEAAFPGGTHGLAVIEGLRRDQMDSLLVGSGAALANDNAPLQFVLAGPVVVLDDLCARAPMLGAHRAQRLRISVPSHTAALQPAADELRWLVDATEIAPPAFPLYANRNARRIVTADKLREELANNLAAPVLWRDIMTALESLNIGLFVEAPPGHTLASLAKANLAGANVLSAADTRWDIVLREARRHR